MTGTQYTNSSQKRGAKEEPDRPDKPSKARVGGLNNI